LGLIQEGQSNEAEKRALQRIAEPLCGRMCAAFAQVLKSAAAPLLRQIGYRWLASSQFEEGSCLPHIL
jgi:hypothetical protein